MAKKEGDKISVWGIRGTPKFCESDVSSRVSGGQGVR